MGALLGVLMFTTPGVANAMTVRVSGTITETFGGTCGEPVWAGYVATIECVGLVDEWEGVVSGTGTFDETISLNFVSGEVHVSGTETFEGCVGPISCGTLTWAYQGSGALNLETFAIISIEGVQHLTGGTEELAGARGAIRFSLAGEGPATYGGVVVL